MQASTFATFHWLLYPVLLVSCHSCTQNRLSQAYTDTYIHTQRFRTMLFSNIHISEVILSNSLLAKTLIFRPLTAPSVKMWCELKAHSSFCSLGKELLGWVRRKWREDLFLPVHYLQCPLHKVKLGDCLSFNKQLKVNLQEVFFCYYFNPQLSHTMLRTWRGEPRTLKLLFK